MWKSRIRESTSTGYREAEPKLTNLFEFELCDCAVLTMLAGHLAHHTLRKQARARREDPNVSALFAKHGAAVGELSKQGLGPRQGGRTHVQSKLPVPHVLWNIGIVDLLRRIKNNRWLGGLLPGLRSLGRAVRITVVTTSLHLRRHWARLKLPETQNIR